MTEEQAPNTTFLKWVVIILGILILGVAGLIIVTIYKRALTPSVEDTVNEIPVPEVLEKPVLDTKFGDVLLDVPDGMKIVNVSGAGNRILVTYGISASELHGVLVVHAISGEILGQIRLKK
ncbi:MAG: hypothetical protein JKY12_01960 [Sneathiella sp.]|nr:hypothetical protein [Sneathiella sp.]